MPRPTLSLGALVLLGIAVALAGLFAAGCRREDSDYARFARDAVPVTVAVAVQEPVAKELHEIGTVEPYSTVAVKSQVEGVVVAVHFREGQDVKRGDLLFTIDPRPFQAELDRAQANLASDSAKFRQARDEEQRWAYMLKQGIGSQERYDQARAEADALRAAGEADRAAVRTAQLNLDYCTITSPIDGRTGSLILHAGNLVKANADTPMLVINQIKPVYVDFSAPEKDLGEIRAQAASGTLQVTATGQENGSRPVRGVLSFIDNAVDKATGTIQLKGLFANQDLQLWPGQFVNVGLKLGERPNAILIPSQAVETGQEGQYVYVVEHDQTVQIRKVVAGDTVDGKTVIERGLKPGERVVSDGQLRLVPGARVKIKPALDATQDLTS
jgi:membrane fusion protein, multidrug efflux system